LNHLSLLNESEQPETFKVFLIFTINKEKGLVLQARMAVNIGLTDCSIAATDRSIAATDRKFECEKVLKPTTGWVITCVK